jgi:exonuclease SbcC
MRIRSVTAHAFGPLREETLTFADGMTVVVGDNESGKSSWHAAMFAALCGRRRGRGRPRDDEQRFADLHKPWDHDDWRVSAQISLDDGRRIELQHDLAGKVDCQAKDLDIGQDVSSEVMHDGSPDGSRWLGLDRSTFAATACVEQAQLLRVLGEADGLQQHLQRAAATAGTDTTTAAALDCLEAFQREQVGTDRANSTKPLRRAMQAHEHAEHELENTRRAHVDYLARIQRVDELREAAATAAAQVRAHEAAAAAARARRRTTQADRASELYAVYGDTPPVSVADDDLFSRQVAEALAAWRSMPPQPVAPSRTSQQLWEELSALPAAPEGDVEEHPSVRCALERVCRGQAQLELHDRDRSPDHTPTVSNVPATDDELLDLARALETPPPDLTPAGVRAHTAGATSPADLPRWRMATALLVAGTLAAVIGVLLLVSAGSAVGIAVVVLGAALLVGGAVTRKRRHDGVDVSDRADAAQVSAAEATRRREQAAARCRELGVAADPMLLRGMPKQRAQQWAQAANHQLWAQRRTELHRELTAAEDELARALTERGQPSNGLDAPMLVAAAAQYQDACRVRAAQASAARRHGDLTAQLAACQAADARAARDAQERSRAGQLVIAAARACSLPAQTPQEAAAALDKWSQQRATQLATLSRAHPEWAKLQALLEGGSIADLTQSARSAAEKAAELTAAVDQTLLVSVDEATARDRLPELQDAASTAQTQTATAEGELHALAATIGSVAEAEEAFEAAKAELERVRQLQRTLDLTREFLQTAQIDVHREIAPILAQTVKCWLPAVTSGRYTDVTVKPTSLHVEVCGPTRHWRSADRLSYGTAEQIYLLLRVALADHLTRGHDTCPLLLDDVTVHADATRTRDLLDLLLDLSTERQIVVFTQEEQVAAWARQHLTGPKHAIVNLSPAKVV